MAAPVRIEAEAWSDLRFATVARLCGLADLEHALIKVSRIWSWQTEHYTPEAPTYVVDVDLVESALGVGGAAAMVRSRLAEEVPEGLRIRGSRGRIEWLYQKRASSAKGGEALKRKMGNKDRPVGQPLGQPAAGPNAGPLPLALAITDLPDLPPARAREGVGPVESDAPVSQPPDSEAPLLSPARTVLTPADVEAARTSRRVAIGRDLWQLLDQSRSEVIAELGLKARPLGLFETEARDLRDRIREVPDHALDAFEATAQHAIAMAKAQALADRSVQYLTGVVFRGGSWDRASGMTLEDATKPRDRRRAAPAGDGRVGRVEPLPPEAYGSGDQEL